MSNVSNNINDIQWTFIKIIENTTTLLYYDFYRKDSKGTKFMNNVLISATLFIAEDIKIL